MINKRRGRAFTFCTCYTDNFKFISTSAEKIFTVMDMIPEVVDENDAIELEDIKGAIINEFQSVDLLYLLGVKLKE